MRAEINNTETTKQQNGNNETKNWFFKITKKVDQALASLINKKTEKN